MKAFATQYPEIKIVGMSRRGQPREGETVTQTLPNVSYIKGNCLEPESFKNQIHDVDAIIHTVGILFPSWSNENLSYRVMNRDAAVNMARELNN